MGVKGRGPALISSSDLRAASISLRFVGSALTRSRPRRWSAGPEIVSGSRCSCSRGGEARSGVATLSGALTRIPFFLREARLRLNSKAQAACHQAQQIRGRKPDHGQGGPGSR